MQNAQIMKNFYDLNLQQMQEALVEMGEPKYRAKQIYSNFASGKGISEMTDIPLSLREKLLENYCDTPAKIYKKLRLNQPEQKNMFRTHLQN